MLCRGGVMSDKHAYLIMCHTNFDQLLILLNILDDERNDIYLHIDKKAKGFSLDDIKQHIKHSVLHIIKPMRVNWGGDSFIELELRLLRESTRTHHMYYHLLSGMDLPIKSQDYIHSFFGRQSGNDFVGMERKHDHNLYRSFMCRLDYYYIFQNIIERGKGRIACKIQWKLVHLQEKCNIRRTKRSNIEFQKGPQWFSITHKTACIVLDEYKKYKKYFRYTFCADEIFLQTILNNSPQIDKTKVIDDTMRYIDWDRGKPYTFRLEDYDTIINSNKLFARKFDINVDERIITAIADYVGSR